MFLITPSKIFLIQREPKLNVFINNRLHTTQLRLKVLYSLKMILNIALSGAFKIQWSI